MAMIGRIAARTSFTVKFPKLMRGTTKVVLFHDPHKGTVVLAGDGDDVGYYSQHWDMNSFTDFTEEIILSNIKG